MTDNENRSQTDCGAERPPIGDHPRTKFGGGKPYRCIHPAGHDGDHWDGGHRPACHWTQAATPLQETADRVTATLERDRHREGYVDRDGITWSLQDGCGCWAPIGGGAHQTLAAMIARGTQVKVDLVASERDTLAGNLAQVETQRNLVTGQRDAAEAEVRTVREQARRMRDMRDTAARDLADAEAELARVREQRDRLDQRAHQACGDLTVVADQRDRLAEHLNAWRATVAGLLGDGVAATPDQLAAYVEGLVVALDQAKSCVSVNVTLDPERLHWTAAKTMAARNPRPDNFAEGIACGVRTAHARGVWRECDLEADHDGPHRSTGDTFTAGFPNTVPLVGTTEPRSDEWIADQDAVRHLDGPLRKAAVALSELIDHRFAQAGIPQGPDPETACSCGASEVCDTIGDES